MTTSTASSPQKEPAHHRNTMTTSTASPPAQKEVAGRRNTLSKTLGLAKDGVRLAKPAVSASFGFANVCVDAGFYIPKKITQCIHLNSPVDLAHSLTRNSLKFSNMIAQSSLEMSDRMLQMAGAEDDTTYQLLKDYVDSQSHLDGHDMREALLGISALLVEVGQELLVQNPLLLIQGARKLAQQHEMERQERIARRQESKTSTTTPPTSTNDWASSLYYQYATAFYGAQAALMGECCGSMLAHEIIIPHPSELSSLSRHMKFAAAAYGAKSCKFMGCCKADDSLIQYWSSDVDCILSLTGIPDESDILYSSPPERNSSLYRPAHFVAIDHAHKEVVISIRGTLSLHDVLVDLVCRNESFESLYDGPNSLVSGKVHSGFLKSAQTLANDMHELVATTLRQYPSYELVIVGHSLGSGVATLLALLWASRIPEFQSRNVRAIAYASPCVVCEKLSQAPFTRRHVTSIVTGDDVVSRFGLVTFRELQNKLTTLAAASTSNDMEENTSPHAPTQPPPPPQQQQDDNEEKLYCAGRVWWLESKEYEPHPIVQVNPVTTLNQIELFGDMFAIHMPSAYLESLEKLDKWHQNDTSDI